MNNKDLFMAIKLSDNDFTNLLEKACNLLISLLEYIGEAAVCFNNDQVKKLLADTVARLSVIDDSCTNEFYKYNKENTPDYDSEFERLHKYILNNIEVFTGIDKVADVLLSNISNKKESIKEFGLDSKDALKFYLALSSDFSLIPHLFWDNCECIILRICIDEHSRALKSQVCLI